VHFENEECATKAIEETNGHNIAGKPVYVGHFERRTERATGATKFTNVYVKNIPQDWDEIKFSEVFGQFGKVTSVALRQAGDKHSGLKYGFVNFETHEEASHAVEGGNQLEFNGQKLFCDRFQKRNERMSLLGKLYEERRREKVEKFKNLNLYVKNLDDDVDEAKLRELFAPFGDISSCVIMRDEKGSRGFGFVCYSNADDANKALESLNGQVVGSKPLYINRAQRKEERRAQLEHSFMAGQRLQQVAMYFPPNMPMQPPFMQMQPQFRRISQAPMQGVPMRYPTSYFPPNAGGRGGSRGRGAIPQGMSRGGYAPQGMSRGRGGMRGGVPQNRYPREQPQQVMPPQTMMPSQELSASMLASATPEVQKQILGERLYPLVFKENQKLAAKITGMFLEMETSEILTLLEMPSELHSKIQEALLVLEQTNLAN
jgi:polyadenylate-binding protein